MDLSIIIVTCNSEQYILDCLNSVEKAARELRHEIFLIDNKSTDQTKVVVKRFKNAVTIIENSENYGFAQAVNMGLERSSGDFILLLNPDVVIQSSSLRPMIDFMRDHPEMGICGCKLLNRDSSLQYSKGSFPTLFSILYRMILPRRMRKYDLWGYDKTGKCDWVTGAFMLIRNRLFGEVGRLDENYFMYYEDMDFCLQAHNKGWEVCFYPGIKADHLNPHAMSDGSSFVENEIRKSRLYFFRKNRSPASYFILLILTRIINK
jgi:GT2 family glycosyltransferase